MKLPRKGILIRLAIYLPVIGGLLIWRAFFAGPAEEPTPAPTEVKTKTFYGPNGEQIDVPVISEEEARAMGIKVPEPQKGASDEPTKDPG